MTDDEVKTLNKLTDDLYYGPRQPLRVHPKGRHDIMQTLIQAYELGHKAPKPEAQP